MAQRRKATRNAAGGELSEKQAEAEFVKIRDGPQRIKRAATLRAIKRYYEADEIEVTSKKVSLICPISKTRVKVPVRSVNCRHMECFDLRSYLNYHQQLTFWECPFSCCKAQARCDSLRVDEYMSDVLRAIDDCAQEVEVFADGSFKAVQRTAPTKAVIIDDEYPYVPDSDSDTEPVVKAETNNDNPDEPMETAVFPANEGQSQAYPLVACGEEQSLEALNQIRPPSASLPSRPGSANNLVEQAESDAPILRGDSNLLREEPSATAQDTHEITSENQERRARLDVMPTAEEASQQADHEPIEPESFSMDEDPHESSPSMAAEDADDDAAQATTESGASEQGQPLPEHNDGSSSDASIPLSDLSDATSVEVDGDLEEEPSHAPKQRKKKAKGRFTCAECGRVFSSGAHLRSHQRTHSVEKPYKCGQCGKAFAESGDLRKHERIHTGVRPYKCAQCSAAFTSSSGLRNHERIHTGMKPHKCGECGKAFVTANNLRRHVQAHTGVKPYKCTQCDKAFTARSSLRTHERIHTGMKPFKCAQCGKVFARADDLRKHENVHTGVKPHKCEVCGKTFAAAGNLRIHERIHTGAKPFKCAECDAAFARSDVLLRHQRLHTGEKPYKCAQCGAAFPHASSLRTHEQHHTGVKPHKCGQCGMSFGQSSNLRRHARRQHAVAAPPEGAQKTVAQARSQPED